MRLRRGTNHTDHKYHGLNIFRGCVPGGISEGCENCCALRTALRVDKSHGNSSVLSLVLDHKNRDWNGKVYFDEDLLYKAVLSWPPKNYMISYMGEVGLANEKQLSEVMANLIGTHTYTFLTKLPHVLVPKLQELVDYKVCSCPEKVSVAVSVENKKHLKRVEELVQLRGLKKEVWFLPLVEGIEDVNLEGVDLVKVGGETGPNGQYRPFKQEWAQAIKDLCTFYNTEFFFEHGAGSALKR